MADIKYCANPECGKHLTPKEGEAPNRYAKRITCGVQCSGIMRRSKFGDEIRLCAYSKCQKPLYKKPKESSTIYLSRNTCDRVCAGLHRAERKVIKAGKSMRVKVNNMTKADIAFDGDRKPKPPKKLIISDEAYEQYMQFLENRYADLIPGILAGVSVGYRLKAG